MIAYILENESSTSIFEYIYYVNYFALGSSYSPIRLGCRLEARRANNFILFR